MENNIYNYKSNNEKETSKFGKIIGELLEPGQLILLAGELGAGKTTLVQGICKGAGVDEDVSSPTYTLINEYEGELSICHVDLYRLDKEEDLYDIGIEDYLDNEAVVLIEWPELVYDFLPPDFIFIKIEVEEGKKREFNIEAEGEKSFRLIKGLTKYAGNGH
ncbi:MAG TPA: tRNA (adenosine(37)-N6)-threonylcarbamoyltransferase complex ATPase subunit type 1 TsaE [Halanaerobiales bacterium]|nr:tRNA (adenosine(37)-N6)-threonylcarbamoyltransferase complex ATPase subunit type 1 TsaE [Halanaerobiales bacterium]